MNFFLHTKTHYSNQEMDTVLKCRWKAAFTSAHNWKCLKTACFFFFKLGLLSLFLYTGTQEVPFILLSRLPQIYNVQFLHKINALCFPRNCSMQCMTSSTTAKADLRGESKIFKKYDRLSMEHYNTFAPYKPKGQEIKLLNQRPSTWYSTNHRH